MCKPREEVVADALEGSRYTIVRSVGNPAMFLISEADVLDFTEETEDDLTKYDASIIEELHEVRAAQRISLDFRASKPNLCFQSEHVHCKETLAQTKHWSRISVAQQVKASHLRREED